VAVFLLPFLGRNFLTQALYEVRFDQAKEDYGLADNDVFLDLSQTPRVQCFYRCSMDCRCSAFQMFKDTDCQLLSSSRAEVTLQRMPGYTYYDIIPWQVIITFSWSVSCQHENKTIQSTLVTLTFRALFKSFKDLSVSEGASTERANIILMCRNKRRLVVTKCLVSCGSIGV
jgi:hypothetical protein